MSTINCRSGLFRGTDSIFQNVGLKDISICKEFSNSSSLLPIAKRSIRQKLWQHFLQLRSYVCKCLNVNKDLWNYIILRGRY